MTRRKINFILSICIITIILILFYYIGIIKHKNDIENNKISTVNNSIEKLDATDIDYEPNLNELAQQIYREEYFASTKYHDEINEEIFNIRENMTLSNYEKICKIGILLQEKGNIKYKSGSNLFNWNNELLDEDFNEIGCYYKDGMTFDCSGFMQYLVWISTGNSLHDGILIGRGTYFSSIEGVSVKQNDLKPGMLCFHYNGGSGVIRTGEVMLEGETKAKDSNHVAIYLGDGKYLDCSESYGGLRIVDTNENPFYLEFYTWFRDVLTDNTYVTNLEIQYQELL